MAFKDLRAQATRRTKDELIKHMSSFEMDLQFTAGIWFFGPANSRFHDRYKPEVSLEQRLDSAATALADLSCGGDSTR